MTDLQRTDEWLEARLGCVTASRIEAVMAKGKGSTPSATRKNYMFELVVETLTGSSGEGGYMNSDMQRGIDLEPLAVSAYEFTSGLGTQEVGFVKHPTIEKSGASPDRLVEEDGLVEIKCPKTANHFKYWMDGTIDRGYILQMQWQMACTGREWCDFVSYDPTVTDPAYNLHIRRIERDNALISEIEDEVRAFLTETERTVEQIREKAGQ
jgi:putative phage-type endonuclease